MPMNPSVPIQVKFDPPDWLDYGSESSPGVPYVRPEPKVGRNDPCPCGSGKKYKKCCLGKIE